MTVVPDTTIEAIEEAAQALGSCCSTPNCHGSCLYKSHPDIKLPSANKTFGVFTGLELHGPAEIPAEPECFCLGIHTCGPYGSDGNDGIGDEG